MDILGGGQTGSWRALQDPVRRDVVARRIRYHLRGLGSPSPAISRRGVLPGACPLRCSGGNLDHPVLFDIGTEIRHHAARPLGFGGSNHGFRRILAHTVEPPPPVVVRPRCGQACNRRDRPPTRLPPRRRQRHRRHGRGRCDRSAAAPCFVRRRRGRALGWPDPGEIEQGGHDVEHVATHPSHYPAESPRDIG